MVFEEQKKRYITATYDSKVDEEFLKDYEQVTKIGGFDAHELFKLGVEQAKKSKQFKERLAELLEQVKLK